VIVTRNGKAFEAIEELVRLTHKKVASVTRSHTHANGDNPLTFANACAIVKYFGGEDAIFADSEVGSARNIYVEKKGEQFAIHVPISWLNEDHEPTNDNSASLVVLRELARVLFCTKQWELLPDGIIDRFEDIQDEEVKANIFARGMIMPHSKFLKSVFANTLDGKCNTLKVARRFGVHYNAVLQRGIDLNLWSA
jgi:hypothetical protein